MSIHFQSGDIPIEHFPAAQVNPRKTWFCVIDAVNHGFPHLTWTQIEKPPRGYFDAAMARQIGFYIMVVKLGVPKKRAAKLFGTSMEFKWRCLPRIHARMKTLRFANHVAMMTNFAKRRIEEEMAK